MMLLSHTVNDGPDVIRQFGFFKIRHPCLDNPAKGDQSVCDALSCSFQDVGSVL